MMSNQDFGVILIAVFAFILGYLFGATSRR